ncbi:MULTISPECIES: GNAT family N-acetyltransferase [Exiguobacterium]|uniref:GNAT family N-acetyltransferase n=1 Tax=Exiguobacterium TaxID=33986 RepID=UPI001BE8C816|nr:MULTISPECIES: GNAT family N-acetyltransferase [Exiguobacterium]MCT4783807.1 GNAT family N-acetyltransferase [Exiguobacterium himgiriensis]
MMDSIRYTTEPPADFGDLMALYEELGWNSLELSAEELERMCRQSWYALYAFDDHRLVGMGRVISDGVITGIICGVGVSPNDQAKGIGKNIMVRLVHHCEQNRVIPQLMCVEDLEPYYEKLGFEKFSIGMTKRPAAE